MAASQYPIVIEGEPCLVWAAQDGRQWLAWGNFRGHHVKASDRTESGAVAKWRTRAAHLANA